MEWKKSTNVEWARENLWNKIHENGDKCDTYINRITQEVLKESDRSCDNCAFVVSVVNLMFDPKVQTTTLTGEMIRRKMKSLSISENDDRSESNNGDSGDDSSN